MHRLQTICDYWLTQIWLIKVCTNDSRETCARLFGAQTICRQVGSRPLFLGENYLRKPRKQASLQLSPSSLAVVSVSSCKSWSTHGLKFAFDASLVFPAEVEVVSVPRDFTSMKPMTKHRTAASTGVRTDRRAMTAGADRRGHRLSADLVLWNTDIWGESTRWVS